MKLTDTQAIILNKAAQHDDGLVQPPDTVAMPAAAKNSVAKALVSRALVEPVSPPEGMSRFRWAGPGAALRITAAGLEAIGVDPAEWPAYARHAAATTEQPEAVDIADLTPEAHPIAAANAANWKSIVPKRGGRKAAEEAAARGELPQPPDFSADTHKPYRAKLAKLVAMAEVGDIDGLKAMPINRTSTSPKALARWRDLAVMALEARAAR